LVLTVAAQHDLMMAKPIPRPTFEYESSGGNMKMAHEIVVILIISMFVLATVAILTCRCARMGPFSQSKPMSCFERQDNLKTQKTNKQNKANKVEPRNLKKNSKAILMNRKNSVRIGSHIDTSRGLLRVIEEVEGESSVTRSFNQDK